MLVEKKKLPQHFVLQESVRRLLPFRQGEQELYVPMGSLPLYQWHAVLLDFDELLHCLPTSQDNGVQ